MKLVLFDVDGTLVDSQRTIVAAMCAAFDDLGLQAPETDAILSIVGLSLDHAMARLAPDQPAHVWADLVAGYKAAYMAGRAGNADYAPLYPGAIMALDALAGRADVLLGVATGKSRRGLALLCDAHDLNGHFVTRQTADDHPSKPHPSMILTAMAETGADPGDTVMIGDTSFDMDMARAAEATGIAVSWGYHPSHTLDSDHLLQDFAQLDAVLARIWDQGR